MGNFTITSSGAPELGGTNDPIRTHAHNIGLLRGSRVSRREKAKQNERITLPAVACIALVTLVPIAFLPGGFFIFLPIKWMLGLTFVLGGLGAAITTGRVRKMLLLPWMGFIAIALLATIFSVDRLTSLIGSPGRNLGLIAWVLFAAAFYLGTSVSAKEQRFILIAACAASIIVSVYGLLQSLGFDLIHWQSTLDTSRSRSTFGNAAFLGGYLVLVIPLAVRLAFEEARVGTRWLLAAASLLAIACLITTQTRGAWIGAAVALLTIAILQRKALMSDRRVAAALGATLLVALALVLAIAPLRERVASIADPSSGTARGRIIQWRLTTDLIAKRPILGWGPDTFRTEFPQVIDEEFEIEVGRDVVPDRAHNAYLDIAAGMGVLGALAYLILQLVALRRVLRSRNTVAVAIFAALVGYIAQSLFTFPIVDVDLLFWLLAGIGLAASNPEASATSRTTAATTVGLSIVVVAVVALIWSGREVRADLLLGRGLRIQDHEPLATAGMLERSARLVPERTQFAQAAARFRSRVGQARHDESDFESALSTFDAAIDSYKRDGELRLDRADLLLAWGEANGDTRLTMQAEHAYEEVLVKDPFSSRALLKLGVALVERERYEGAESAWRRAAQLAPRSAVPHVNLGLLYEKLGRADDALREFRVALRIDPRNDGARSGLTRLDSIG